MPTLAQEVPSEVVSLRTIGTRGNAVFERHGHPFLEFTLVADDDCCILYPPGRKDAKANTLFLYHEDEMHGAICSEKQRPRFWVLQFHPGQDLMEEFRCLRNAAAQERTWTLSPENAETFQWFFLQMLSERSKQREGWKIAMAAWLRLLVVHVNRWAASNPGPAALPATAGASPEVMRLWQQINEAVPSSNDELDSVFAAPGYDSTRHAFRKVFGCSPRKMLHRLRLERAMSLLLETNLNIKEIAARVGYPRQHEFNRFFQRYTGMAPSEWRSDPEARCGAGK